MGYSSRPARCAQRTHLPPLSSGPSQKIKKTHVVFFSLSVDPLGLTPSTAVCALFFSSGLLPSTPFVSLPPTPLPPKVRVQNIYSVIVCKRFCAQMSRHRLLEVGGVCCWDSRLLPTTIKCRYSLYILLSIAQLLGTLRDVFYFLLLKERKKKRDGL